MTFNEHDYTEDAMMKQLALVELHSKDGSAVEAGCSCIESKHSYIIEGLAEEMKGFALTEKEKQFYEQLGEWAREFRKRIEGEDFTPIETHSPIKKAKTSRQPESFEPHTHSIKRDSLEPYVEAGRTKKDIGEWVSTNPHGRLYLPHGLTECEKDHPSVVKKLAACIRAVEEREQCSPPYMDCVVNPVAVCRASISCP